MTYQLSEQHFPVAVPFHNLQEVTAQRAVIPALKTAARWFFLRFSFLFGLNKQDVDLLVIPFKKCYVYFYAG